jgi:hypothetical protein
MSVSVEAEAIEQFDLILEPGRATKNYWRDLWRYRELFYFLAWRDILVCYKQTVIGIAWALIRPFLTMIVFVVVFSKVAKLPAPGEIPYLSIVGLRRDAAVAVLFDGVERIEQQLDRQRQPDLQSLFPAPDRPGEFRHHQLRGLSD